MIFVRIKTKTEISIEEESGMRQLLFWFGITLFYSEIFKDNQGKDLQN